MAYPKCPAGCGLKFVDQAHAERHADAEHAGWSDPKPVMKRGWATPWGFVDFAEKVSFEHACKVAKSINDKYAHKNTDGGQTQDIESIGKSGVQTL